MNQCLLFPSDLQANDCAIIADRRHEHLTKVLKTKVGDSISVGLLNGLMGQAIILDQDKQQTRIQLKLHNPAPKACDITVVLALPRPNMLKRSLQNMAALGIKKIYMIHSQRVEKSFWSSPQLRPETLQNELVLGLEQAKDTVLPTIEFRQKFKPFAEDELPQLAAGRRAIVAHPSNNSQSFDCNQQATLLAIGPEGGFIEQEVVMLEQAGLQRYSLGPRILRVETAVPVLISKLWQL